MTSAEDIAFYEGCVQFISIKNHPGFKWFLAEMKREAESQELLAGATSWEHFTELRGKWKAIKEITEAPEKLVFRGETIKQEIDASRKKQ